MICQIATTRMSVARLKLLIKLPPFVTNMPSFPIFHAMCIIMIGKREKYLLKTKFQIICEPIHTIMESDTSEEKADAPLKPANQGTWLKANKNATIRTAIISFFIKPYILVWI